MINNDLQAIILAAGKSKRFNTLTSKLIEKLCGQEMVLHITSILQKLNIDTTVVVGHQKEMVEGAIRKYHGNSIKFVTQDKQEGTGHAVACSQSTWQKNQILVMNGDMPLVNTELVENLYKKHQETKATMSLAVAYDTDPSGAYGRIVQKGSSLSIIEAKEFTYDIEEHPFINAGIYLFDREFLESSLAKLQRNPVTNEFYITDLVKIASDQHKTITPVTVALDRVRGINTLKELWAAEQILRSEIISYWMNQGVRFTMPQTVHVDLGVTIGKDTIIEACAQLLGSTHIGSQCRIGSFSYLNNAQLQDQVTVQSHCVIHDSTIKAQSCIGPFAHVCDNSNINVSAPTALNCHKRKSV